MPTSRCLRYGFILLLSLFAASSVAPADAPHSKHLSGVPRIKQLTNYCGPACLAAVIESYGRPMTQEQIGRAIYDDRSGATNGADMLLFSREIGFAAYSWNSSIPDLKAKLDKGVPVIVLQQNSAKDTSGHYRVVTGYDDASSTFYVMDPYYEEITELSYTDTKRLWQRMGYWALVIVPADRDVFAIDLGTRNAVVHMDLAFAQFKRKRYTDALTNTRLALALEPRNSFALSMQDKIENAMGAGKKQ